MPKEHYCQAEGCEAVTARKFQVSENRPGDSKRYYCWGCSEVYHVGVQHGRLSENPNAYRAAVKVPEPLGALQRLLNRLEVLPDQHLLRTCAGSEIDAAKAAIAQHHVKRKRSRQ